MTAFKSNPLCPDNSTLTDFLLGRLPESKIRFLEHHLEDCHPCGDTIRLLDAVDTKDDLARNLPFFGTQLQLDSPSDQPAIDDIISRLQSNGPLEIRNSRQVEAEKAESSRCDNEVTRLLSPSDDASHLGRFGHYEVLQLLGTGGTGVVYKAIDTRLERRVALKILRPSLGSAARDRFLSEARSAARIDHEKVVTIYHVGQEGALAYIAMQWLPGETLEQSLCRETVLCNETARDIFREITLGLAAAHQQGLIHRDIKPDNIWIESRTGRVKILDFGLARVADDDPRFTETGMIAGTPTYMSPEQTRGMAIDQRSDLFSLGCVLYRMIAGQLPFQAPNVLATLQSIQRFSPPHPTELNPAASRELGDLCMCLLEKNQPFRPQTAVSVLHALESEQNEWGFPIPVEPASPVAPATESSRSNSDRGRRFLIGAAIFGLLAFAGCWMYGQQIIRIVSGKGQIVIESSDPDVEIEVLQNGKRVKILDSLSGQSIDFYQGVYQFRPVSNDNSIRIEPGQLTLSRGETEIVKVSVTPNATGVPDSAKDADAKEQATIGVFVKDTENRIASLELELAEQSKNRTSQHPSITRLREELVMLYERLDKVDPSQTYRTRSPLDRTQVPVDGVPLPMDRTRLPFDDMRSRDPVNVADRFGISSRLQYQIILLVIELNDLREKYGAGHPLVRQNRRQQEQLIEQLKKISSLPADAIRYFDPSDPERSGGLLLPRGSADSDDRETPESEKPGNSVDPTGADGSGPDGGGGTLSPAGAGSDHSGGSGAEDQVQDPDKKGE